jgi:hypothetical protein
VDHESCLRFIPFDLIHSLTRLRWQSWWPERTKLRGDRRFEIDPDVYKKASDSHYILTVQKHIFEDFQLFTPVPIQLISIIHHAILHPHRHHGLSHRHCLRRWLLRRNRPRMGQPTPVCKQSRRRGLHWQHQWLL